MKVFNNRGGEGVVGRFILELDRLELGLEIGVMDGCRS